MQLDNSQPYVINLYWQSPAGYIGDIPSPNYSYRGGLYGVGGIPHVQFQGTNPVVGGGTNMYPYYLPVYNSLVNFNSPLIITPGLGAGSAGGLAIQADVELTANITTTNNKIIFILTRYINAEYYCAVVRYAEQDFTLTQAGQTGTFEAPITLNNGWDISELTAVVLVQSFGNNHQILQAADTQFTGILPLFNTNVTSGPPSLKVDFTDYSFPLGDIDLWEWDFDGDGIFDSYEQNPTHYYNEPGSYDVTLRITVGAESSEFTAEGLINVLPTNQVSGPLNGIWRPEYGTYVIIDDASIEEDAELVIEPGTTIMVGNGSQIYVQGHLEANAEADQSIIFDSDSGWSGFIFNNTQQANIFNNCQFSGATSSVIKVEYDSHLEIIGSRFLNNSCSSNQATAIDITGSHNVLIHRNVIANNINTSLTGGIGCTGSNPLITNNLIVNNGSATALAGAFSIKSGSVPIIRNNTIANNLATNSAVFMFNSSPVLMNNIIIHDGNLFTTIGSFPDVTYSCLSSGYTGEGNISDDPLFIAPSAGNGPEFNGYQAIWYLDGNSPCVDTGNPSPEYYDIEDPANPGFALWPALGTLTNDMGAFGGDGLGEYTGAEDPVFPQTPSSSISVYPNPFNPFTQIRLNLSEADSKFPVDLAVFNTRGQLVKKLLDDTICSSGAVFFWDGTDHNLHKSASGLYLIRMQTNSGVSTGKLILLK